MGQNLKIVAFKWKKIRIFLVIDNTINNKWYIILTVYKKHYFLWICIFMHKHDKLLDNY